MGICERVGRGIHDRLAVKRLIRNWKSLNLSGAVRLLGKVYRKNPEMAVDIIEKFSVKSEAAGENLAASNILARYYEINCDAAVNIMIRLGKRKRNAGIKMIAAVIQKLGIIGKSENQAELVIKLNIKDMHLIAHVLDALFENPATAPAATRILQSVFERNRGEFGMLTDVISKKSIIQAISKANYYNHTLTEIEGGRRVAFMGELFATIMCWRPLKEEGLSLFESIAEDRLELAKAVVHYLAETEERPYYISEPWWQELKVTSNLASLPIPL